MKLAAGIVCALVLFLAGELSSAGETPIYRKAGDTVFSGEKRGLVCREVKRIPWREGLTLTAVFQRKTDGPAGPAGRLDAFFYRHRELAVARRGDRLGVCFHREGKWGSWYETPRLPELNNKTRRHHLAVTLRRHSLIDQGEAWNEVRFYLDGKLVGEHRIPGLPPEGTSDFLEIGSAESFGLPWRFSGVLADVAVCGGVLTEERIRELVLASPGVTPAFKVERRLSERQKRLIDESGCSPAVRSALARAAGRGVTDEKLRELIRSASLSFTVLEGKTSQLVISRFPDACGVLSWFDGKTGRELLGPDAPFFALTLSRMGRPVVLDGQSPAWRVKVQPAPSGAVLLYELPPPGEKLAVRLELHFADDRLTAKIDVENAGKAPLARLDFPVLSFQVPDPKNARVLTPEGSGVARPWQDAAKKPFDGDYPRGACAMPLGAFYTPETGVMLALMDERAASKRLRVVCSGNVFSASFTHRIPPGGTVRAGTAVWQLFRGDWYDAGLIYRGLLEEYAPRWWKRSIRTPAWAVRNAFRLPWPNLQFQHLPELLALKKYLGVPYLLDWRQWQECVTTSLSPHCRVKPLLAEAIARLREAGIHTSGYCDPRLWPLRDVRGEDVFFTKEALPGTVMRGRKPAVENFGGIPYAVICPAGKTYRKYAPLLVRRMLAQGFDAVYCDQIGAARALPCGSPDHGHAPDSPDNWYHLGQFPVFDAVRSSPEFGKGGMIFTEDNAEPCVGLFDGVLPWRWVYRHQVPLFPLVYSGRTQFFGGISGGTPEASCAVLATQLVNSEQFVQWGITSPLLADLRACLRRMIYLRTALLDFFQEGLMARPPVLAEKPEMIENFWAYHYDRVIATPALVAAAWKLGDCTAYIVINISKETKMNRLVLEKDAPVKCFSSSGRVCRARANDAFEIAPGHFLLMLAGNVPEKLEKHIAEQFRKIASPPPDPFLPDLKKLPHREALSAKTEHFGSDAVKVWNGVVNAQDRSVTYISRTCVCAGTVDFDGTERALDLKLAAPADSGVGRIEVRLDDPVNGKIAAVVALDKKFRTKSWRHYGRLSIPLTSRVEGRHLLFFNFFGEQLCNFGTWRFCLGGEEAR